MTHPARDVALAWALHAEGLNPCQIARQTGVSRASVRDWIRNGRRSDDAPDDQRGSRSYSYWRYQFTNLSDDIRDLFRTACDRLGIEWWRMNARNISVANRPSLEFMDTFIGPKS